MAKMYLGFLVNGQYDVFRIGNDGVRHELEQYDLDGRPQEGFCWGGSGRHGTYNLAISLLFDVTGDANLTLDFYQQYAVEVVARCEGMEWIMFEQQVRNWIEHKRSKLHRIDLTAN